MTLVSPPPYGKGKSKPKRKGKSKEKGKSKGKGKYHPKGKGFGKGDWTSSKGKSKGLNPKDKELPKGNPFIPRQTGTPTTTGSNADTTPAAVRCHFCHYVGHINSNCRKWLALQHSDQYYQKYQLIYLRSLGGL
jgi:hypothetical protein